MPQKDILTCFRLIFLEFEGIFTWNYVFREFGAVHVEYSDFDKSKIVFNGHDYCKTFRLWHVLTKIKDFKAIGLTYKKK